MNEEITIIYLTLKLAILTTIVLLLLALPLCFYFTEAKSRFKTILEPLLNLPLVLPPSVLGFYLLMAFSPNHLPGKFLGETFGLKLVFSFEGILLASVISSLPFMLQPIISGLANINPSFKEASYTLGKSRWKTYLQIQLPNIKPSLLRAILMTFSHTIGNFGVILLVGGGIPGLTQVASIAIYNEIETANYTKANHYALALLLFSLLTLILLTVMGKKLQAKNHD